MGIHELGVRKAILSVVQERLRFDAKAKEKEKEIERPEVGLTICLVCCHKTTIEVLLALISKSTKMYLVVIVVKFCRTVIDK